MERDPKALLWDALAAARLVGLFAVGADFERFDRDDMLRSAFERQLDPVTSCDQRSLGDRS